jgi:hypothetical protein
VIEHACFFLSQDNYTSGSIGKALKHRQTSFLGNYWQAYNFAHPRREAKLPAQVEPQI